MTNEMMNLSIDALVSLKAQIAALQAQADALEKGIREEMAAQAVQKVMTPTGHKALLTPFISRGFDKKKFVAVYGEGVYKEYQRETPAERFSVA